VLLAQSSVLKDELLMLARSVVLAQLQEERDKRVSVTVHIGKGI
jgi:hypothetical protein